jgi:general L-amino acid transport system permease protein
VSRAQYEAATSLGLGYWQAQRAVILPQALVAVIPAFVNNLLDVHGHPAGRGRLDV